MRLRVKGRVRRSVDLPGPVLFSDDEYTIFFIRTPFFAQAGCSYNLRNRNVPTQMVILSDDYDLEQNRTAAS